MILIRTQNWTGIFLNFTIGRKLQLPFFIPWQKWATIVFKGKFNAQTLIIFVLHFLVFKGVIHLKMKILSSFIHPYVVLMSFFLLWNTREDIVKNSFLDLIDFQ